MQEERATVHSDGARQQTTEIADISGGGYVKENISPLLWRSPYIISTVYNPYSHLEGLPFSSVLPSYCSQKVIPCI